MIYAADDGDLITVANFPASILDLPFRSSANDADRGYVAHAGRVPARGTPVTMSFTLRRCPGHRKRQSQAESRPCSMNTDGLLRHWLRETAGGDGRRPMILSPTLSKVDFPTDHGQD